MSWTLIESQTLGSSVASVTLGSGGTIPQTYKTLKLVISARTDQASVKDLIVKPNNSTSNLTMRYLIGTGAAVGTGTGTTGQVGNLNGTGQTASTFNSTEITFPNYAGSTNKPFTADDVSENNGTTAYQTLFANLWSDTTAITSIVLAPNAGNFITGSTFTLYGLK